MSSRNTTIPGFLNIPGNVDPELKRFLENLAEAVEIRLGRKGDPLDRAITLRELVDSGMAETLQATTYDPNNSNQTNRGFQTTDAAISTATVGQVTAFTAAAAYSTVNLSWTFPNYRYHNQTEIWSHTSNVLGDATLTGISTGRGYSDPVGGGVTRYYWARHVNQAGKAGPWNSAIGTAATTATDVAFQLSVLNGAITSSQLASSLATPIANNTTSVSNLNGQYTVKIDTNGNVAGFGLANIASGETGSTSEFMVRADRFALVNATATAATSAWSISASYSAGDVVKHGGFIFQAKIALSATANNTAPDPATGSAGATNWDCLSTPFTVITSNQTVSDGAGGTTTIPPGVYIRSANIQKAAIESAQIKSVNADTISTGTLNVTDRISTNAIDASKIRVDGTTIASQTINGVPTLVLENAAVSTLKIAGNAVTVPKGGTFTATNQVITSSWATAHSLAIDWGTDYAYIGAVYIWCSIRLSGVLGTYINSATPFMRLNTSGGGNPRGQVWTDMDRPGRGISYATAAKFNTPSSQNVTYIIQVKDDGIPSTQNGYWTVSNANVVVMGGKR